MSKKKPDKYGVVFSTDPNFRFEPVKPMDSLTPLAGHQRLRVLIEKKHRGGKEVTLVTGFKGQNSDLEALGKTLKTRCGTGGSVKDGEIIIQGNHRDKVVKMLIEMGYSDTKPAGG